MTETNLTARERQVFELNGKGSSTKEIARALKISIWTPCKSRKRICTKLGVHRTAELVALSFGEIPNGHFPSRPLSADRCHLAADFRARHGHVQLTYSWRLKKNARCCNGINRPDCLLFLIGFLGDGIAAALPRQKRCLPRGLCLKRPHCYNDYNRYDTGEL